MFNFNHLYYFYIVASSESLTNAAKFLKVSQPALSTQIKKFETEVGRNFFVRVGRRLELTSDGRAAFAYCRKIFETASELSDSLKLASVSQGDRLNFGVSDEVERPFAAEVVSSLIKNRVDEAPLSVRMNSDDHHVLLEQLQKRDLDVLLTHSPAPRESLATLATVQMPVRAFVSGKMKRQFMSTLKANRTTAPTINKILSELNAHLIMPTMGQKLRAETEIFLQKTSFRGHLIFESNVMTALVRAVVDGIGLGFFPTPYVANEIRAGRLVELTDTNLWQHSLYLLAGRGDQKNPKIVGLQDSFSKFCVGLGCKVN